MEDDLKNKTNSHKTLSKTLDDSRQELSNTDDVLAWNYLQRDFAAVGRKLGELQDKKKKLLNELKVNNSEGFEERTEIKKQIQQTKLKKQQIIDLLSQQQQNKEAKIKLQGNNAQLVRDNLSEIEESTGAQLVAHEASVTLKGEKEQVRRAKEKINALLKSNQKEQIVVRFKPQQLQGLLNHSSELRKKVPGVEVKIDKVGGVVQLRGDAQLLGKAKNEVQKFLNESMPETVEVNVRDEIISVLLARGGAAIKRIRTESEADRVNVEVDRNVVVIQGRKQSIQKARELVEKVVRDEKDNITVDVRLSRESNVGNLVGKSGSTLKKLEEETSTQINVNKERQLVSIRGSKANTSVARTRVEELLKATVAKKEKETKEPKEPKAPREPKQPKDDTPKKEWKIEKEIPLDAKFFGAVIGKGGENVRSIESQTNTSVKVIRKTSVVAIKADEESDMEKAEQLINDAVEKEKNSQATEEKPAVTQE
jgi:rRNA processing protein Krr1/Pno1